MAHESQDDVTYGLILDPFYDASQSGLCTCECLDKYADLYTDALGRVLESWPEWDDRWPVEDAEVVVIRGSYDGPLPDEWGWRSCEHLPDDVDFELWETVHEKCRDESLSQ
jgi:hypothetical protein